MPHICQRTGSALVQKMGCRLFGAKPLSKPELGYCQLDPEEQTSVKLWSKYKTFHSRKCIWKYRLRNGVHFSRERWVNAMLWFPADYKALGSICNVTLTDEFGIISTPTFASLDNLRKIDETYLGYTCIFHISRPPGERILLMWQKLHWNFYNEGRISVSLLFVIMETYFTW